MLQHTATHTNHVMCMHWLRAYVTWMHLSHNSCHVHAYPMAYACHIYIYMYPMAYACHIYIYTYIYIYVYTCICMWCISSGICMYACFEVLASARGLFSHFLYLIRRAVQGDPGTVPVMKICITCITCITDAFARLADVRKLEETRHSSQHTFSRDIYRSLSPTKTYEYGNNPIHQKRTYRYEKIWKATCMTTDAT